MTHKFIPTHFRLTADETRSVEETLKAIKTKLSDSQHEDVVKASPNVLISELTPSVLQIATTCTPVPSEAVITLQENHASNVTQNESDEPILQKRIPKEKSHKPSSVPPIKIKISDLFKIRKEKRAKKFKKKHPKQAAVIVAEGSALKKKFNKRRQDSILIDERQLARVKRKEQSSIIRLLKPSENLMLKEALNNSHEVLSETIEEGHSETLSDKRKKDLTEQNCSEAAQQPLEPLNKTINKESTKDQESPQQSLEPPAKQPRLVSPTEKPSNLKLNEPSPRLEPEAIKPRIVFVIKDCFVKLTRCPEQIKAASTTSNLSSPSQLNDVFPLVEIKAEPTDEQNTTTKTHVPVKKSVSHLLYTIIDHQLMFQCVLCSFQNQDKSEFVKHLENNHIQYRWLGTCNACSQTNLCGASPILDEFDHLVSFHLLTETVPITNESIEEKPMVSIPNGLIKSSPKGKQTVVLLDSVTTVKKLQPWLFPSLHNYQKYEDVCERMLTLDSLSALYKCMGVSCSFCTEDKLTFLKHLKLHLFCQGGANTLLCSYCSYNAKSELDLCNHVEEEHGSTKYQCAYCFYRSYGLQLDAHQAMFHVSSSPKIIKCQMMTKRSLKNELRMILGNAPKTLPSICCMGEDNLKKTFVYFKFLFILLFLSV